MGERYLLGIDVGTSSLKVAVVCENGEVLNISSCSYVPVTPSLERVEMNSEDVWNAFLKCLRTLVDDENVSLEQVEGIGISCLCPGLIAMDKEGKTLAGPILYSDRRSVQEAQWMRDILGEKAIFEITANRVMAGAVSSTSMLWIKKNQPELYEKTWKFGHINTWMVYRLTGRFGIDYSNASYTGLFETVKGEGGDWSPFLCEKTGLDMDKLPTLYSSSSVVGALEAPEVIAAGVKRGIPVVMGGGDTACAALAAGVTKEGEVCESVGTTDVLTICVEEPRFDTRFLNRCHVVDGTWIYQGAMSHTGASYQWFQKQFCRELGIRENEKDALLLMNQEAKTAAPGCGGVVFLPYMMGERSPVWDPYARGVFFGMTLLTQRRDLNRAVLEGCGYGLRQLCEAAKEVTGRDFSSFVSIGGGAKSQVWAQIKADITGKDIMSLDFNDMAPVGAALLAGVGAGFYLNCKEAAKKMKRKVYEEIHSDRSYAAVYQKGYEIYKGLYPRVRDLYEIYRA